MIPVAKSSLAKYELSSDQRLAKRQNTAPKTGLNKTHYTVRNGDSLWTISRQFNVSVRSLAKWNQMAPGDPLRQGRKLVIWTKDQQQANTTNFASRAPVMRKIGYKVRNGDSIARIADKFSVKTRDVIKWNSLNPKKYLQPDDFLTLYVDITKGVN